MREGDRVEGKGCLDEGVGARGTRRLVITVVGGAAK